MSDQEIADAIHYSLRVFCPCAYCNGEGFVMATWTTREGDPCEELEIFGVEICGECHGTGTTVRP